MIVRINPTHKDRHHTQVNKLPITLSLVGLENSSKVIPINERNFSNISHGPYSSTNRLDMRQVAKAIDISVMIVIFTPIENGTHRASTRKSVPSERKSIQLWKPRLTPQLAAVLCKPV